MLSAKKISRKISRLILHKIDALIPEVWEAGHPDKTIGVDHPNIRRAITASTLKCGKPDIQTK